MRYNLYTVKLIFFRYMVLSNIYDHVTITSIQIQNISFSQKVLLCPSPRGGILTTWCEESAVAWRLEMTRTRAAGFISPPEGSEGQSPRPSAGCAQPVSQAPPRAAPRPPCWRRGPHVSICFVFPFECLGTVSSVFTEKSFSAFLKRSGRFILTGFNSGCAAQMVKVFYL